MRTYFCINKTVVTLTPKDFENKEEIRFGFGVDILLVPLKISEEELKLLDTELITLKSRKGELLFYNNEIEEIL